MSFSTRNSLRQLGRRLTSARPKPKNTKSNLNVESVESRQLLAVFTVLNTGDAGAGSLRQAIIDANAAAGADTINFNIPGAGVHVIQPATVLPAITDNATTINGYSQPGATANTSAVGDNANILIQIDGGAIAAAPNQAGLVLNSSNNSVRGLSITGFGGNIANRFGVVVAGNAKVVSNNVIAGNFIGLNADGVTENGNTNGVGIRTLFTGIAGIAGSVTNNTVGGAANADRNIIAGANDRPFTSAGVQISGSVNATNASSNVVTNNYIGSDRSGLVSNAALANIYGVRIQLGANTNSVNANVLAGNLAVTDAAVLIEDNGSSANAITNNFIGLQANTVPGGVSSQTGISINALGAANIVNTQITGNQIVQTSGDGIFILGPNSGIANIQNNQILNSGDDGISILGGSVGNTILSNVISGSDADGDGNGLAIDLNDDEITVNDFLDADGGANNSQNTTVLTNATNNGVNVRVNGTFTGAPNAQIRIQFFNNDVAGPLGNGEGQRLINDIVVNTDAAGVATYQFDLVPTSAPVGSFIAATATNVANGDTSEFSQALIVRRQILVSIDDAIVTEPDDGGVAFATFTLTANSPLHNGFQVNFDNSLLPGAPPAGFGFAQNSVDYNAQGNAVFFGNGQTRTSVAVPIIGDNVSELDELFQVLLRDAVSFDPNVDVLLVEDPNVIPPVVPPPTIFGQGLILDNDLSFSVDDVQVVEGGNLTFTVTRVGSVNRSSSVSFAVANGTALAGADFTPLAAGTLNFAVGVTTQQVVVATTQDTLPEGAENLLVNLSNPQYGTDLPALAAPFVNPVGGIPVVDAKLDKGVGVGTILDDDVPLATASIGDIVVAENAGNATFTVTLDRVSTTPIVLNFGTSNGSALSGSDYTASAGTIVIPAGQLTGTFNVPLIDNTISEFDETFFANISFQSGNVILGDSQGQATIVDNDGANTTQAIIEAIGSPSSEPGTLTYRVRLVDGNGNPAQSDKTVLVNYTSGAAGDTATANLDYVATAGTLVFAPGENVKVINLAVLDDNVFEAPETASVVLTSAVNGQIQTGTATGVIVDKTVPVVTIGDVVVAENGGNATFTVTLNQLANSPVVLNFGTANGSANANTDYIANAGTVTIPVGQTTATFNIALVDDAISEFDENFFVNLSIQGDNAILGDNQAQGTIVDNDGVATTQAIIEAIGNPSTEPGTLTYRVRLVDGNGNPARSDKTVLINYTSGAAGDTATANLDYVATAGTLAFAPGENVKVINLAVLSDNVFEATETASVVLTNAVNGLIQTGTATGSIIDKTLPVVTIGDVVVAENGANATFTVTLNQQANSPVVLNFGTANGSALAGSDYTATVGTVTIPVGQTTATFNVAIVNDVIPEPNENFFVNLSIQGDNATLGDDQAQATIVDNDDIRVVIDTISNPAVEPKAGETNSVTYRVRLVDQNGALAQSDQTVLVNYNSVAGTATSNADYTAVGGTLSFAPGENIKLIDVNVIGDNVFEPTENFSVDLTFAVNATIQTASAQGTIIDRTVPDAFVGGIVVPENIVGGLATFTVQLQQQANGPVVVAYATENGTAQATEDYTPTNGLVTIPTGQTTATFTVPIVNNNIQEVTENFFANLTVISGNATLLTDRIQATITDDDNNVRVVIEQIDTTVCEPTAKQPQTFANFRVRLISSVDGSPIQSDRVVQVNYRSGAVGDTATSDLDYQGVGGTLTYAPGENIKVISVPILQDGKFEIDPERFTVSLINAVNGSIQVGSAIGTILDKSPAAKLLDAQRLGFHRDPTTIVLKFDTPLDPVSAQNVNNYHLVSSGRDGKFGTRDDAPIRVLVATLSADGHTVTLAPNQIKLARALKLTINGTELDGVRDRNGHLIDGDCDGDEGGNAESRIAFRDLRRGQFLGNPPIANKPFGHPRKFVHR